MIQALEHFPTSRDARRRAGIGGAARLLIASATAFVLQFTLFAGAAGAATTVGSASATPNVDCASGSGNELECTTISRRSGSSSGVLTLWRFGHGPAVAGTQFAFKIADAAIDNVVYSSALGTMPQAAETSPFTIIDANNDPIGIDYFAGEHLGLFVSNPGGTSNADLVEFQNNTSGPGWQELPGNVGVGPWTGLAWFQQTGDLPLEATLEPDLDGDNYGDESQDNCPSQAQADQIDANDPCRPTITLLSGPAANTTSTAAAFTWRSSEFGTSFSCSVDGGAFSACDANNGPVNSGGINLSGLSQTSHSLAVRGADGIGAGTTVVYNWVVDQTPPQMPVFSGPPTSSTSSNATFVFGSDEASTFSCNFDGNVFSCVSPVALSGIGVGSHSFTVTATDLAGNVGAFRSYAWTRVGSSPAGPTGLRARAVLRCKKKLRPGRARRNCLRKAKALPV